MGPEVHQRTAQAAGARGPLRREVYKRNQLPTPRKVFYTDAIVHSVLTFNIHVWNQLTKAEADKMDTGYRKGYRIATGHRAANNPKQHVTNLKIQALANRPSFTLLQRVHRLRYLARLLLLHGPTILLRLLDANARNDHGWAAKIDDDLE